MSKHNFFYKSILLSIIYWFIESIIHRVIFSEDKFEFIPSDINEFWMRIVIVVLLILFGRYADYQTKSILQKEKEKRIIFHATLSSAQHIINNLLNQMQYFKMKADESSVFDDEVNEMYNHSMKEGKELFDKLCSVEELTENNISDSVHSKQ